MTDPEILRLRECNQVLEAEAARRRAIFESAVDFAIVATDDNGLVTDWNAGAQHVLGWTAGEMLGQPLDRFFTPEDRAAGRIRTEMRLARELGRASDERWHLREDGSRFWASGEMMPLRGEGGTHLGFLKILRDRTAEHRAGEVLRDAEARLHRAQEAGGVGVFTIDLVAGHLHPSPEFCRLYGLPERDTFPDTIVEGMVLPEDAAVMPTSVTRGDGTAPLEVEYRIRRAGDGEVRWIARKAEFERDAVGKPVRFVGVVRDVTEQRAAQAAIEEGDRRYRTLFGAIDAGFCVFEMRFDDTTGQAVDYRFLEVNEAFELQTGLVGAVGRWMRDLAPEHEQAWFDRYGEVARTGLPLHFEDEAAALGRHYDISAFRIGPPEARQVAALFRDITDRRRNELALRESEAQFRVFAQAVPNHVWSAFPDGRLEWANDVTYAYSGGASDQTIGNSWTDRVHPEDLSRVAARWRTALSTGETYETEFRVRRADGVYRWFLVRALPVHGSDGAIVRWIGANTDIGDQRAATEALAVMNATLEQQVAERTAERNRLWETTNDLMGTAGLDGYLKALNPAWTPLLGWSERDLLDRPFATIIDPADHAATADVVRRLAAGETVTGFVDHLLTRDGGRRVVMWTAVPEPGEGIFYIVGRDLTEQRQAEGALRQSQKMEAVGQLTGGLAHDFNNLLAGISGSLELMQTRMSQGRLGDLDRYMTVAQGATKRAAALTHRLLAFSRRQTLDPKPTNVNRLVGDLEELIRRTVGPAIQMEVVGSASLWPALIDSGQLENALLNLCINARDAMPDGGRITIETANKWLDETGARQHDMPPGQYLSVCVTDTGTGMPPEIVAKVFEPFFTTKPIGQGTGLGLSMVYGFARQSGGQVRIYSEVGQGTTVCLYLPRHYGEADDGGVALRLSEAGRAGQGETVLIVDDEPTVRMLVTEVLEDLGYTAIEAADSVGGLRLLQSDVRIDLLVTDVGLPGGMNGRQMADAGRQRRSALKVLFITGYAENAVVGNGHLAPGMEVMTKPFVMEALAAKITAMIRG